MKRPPRIIFEPRDVKRSGPTLIEIVQRTERKAILKALRECGGVRAKAARRLGISRSMLYRRMAALNIVVRTTPAPSTH